jgi:hypothetical protein
MFCCTNAKFILAWDSMVLSGYLALNIVTGWTIGADRKGKTT